MATRMLPTKVTPLALSSMQVQVVPIDSLFYWKDNPRENDKGVPALAEIIRTHGVQTPVVAWDKNRVIYKGNTQKKAMKLLGYLQIPVLFRSFPSEAAAIAYGIDDNKASELSGWDYNLLNKLMIASDQGESVKPVGFTEKELGILKSGIFSRVIDKKIIPEYNEQEDLFDIKVSVPFKDKDRILHVINGSLQMCGGGYVAVAE
jgi:ParB-like chromosome segregation protein Spo0J